MSLSKLKKIEIILSVFSDHNNKKLEIKYKEKNGKNKYVEIKQHASK